MARDPACVQAVKDNNVAAVRAFLQSGEEPDDYVLFLSIRYNALDVLRVLIKAGGNLNAVEHPKGGGNTPLGRAIVENNMPAFRLLLKAGALINKPGYFETPISTAAKQGSIAFTKACITAGAEIDARSQSTSKTPLMTAAHFGCTDIVKLLLKSGADPHLVDEIGRTAQKIAADANETEIAELLAKSKVPKKR